MNKKIDIDVTAYQIGPVVLMRRVARMCADCSAREQLDHQEGARA